jgi:hypothetical protein
LAVLSSGTAVKATAFVQGENGIEALRATIFGVPLSNPTRTSLPNEENDDDHAVSPDFLETPTEIDVRTLLRTTLCAFLIVVPSTVMSQNTSEHEAVKATMQKFIRAYETDDGNLMRQVFRGDGMMIGWTKSTDKVTAVRGEEYVKGFEGKPADDEPQRKRSFEILDVSDYGALVKVLMDYPTWRGVDYLTLNKIDGTWVIISKSYIGRSKPAQKK